MEVDSFLQSLSEYLPYPEISGNSYFKQFIRDRKLIKAEEFSD